jgi:hypothetical protein
MHAEMFRVVNPEAASLTVELKDSFDLMTKAR